MPLYDFKNKNTGEIITKMIKISEKEKYLKDNPHLEYIYSAPKVVSEKGSLLNKAGSGWKEVQDRIKSGLPPRLKDNIKTK
tara:strand:+ start:2634 stop:2876 length:243 start_codon:yes stop_codon:yes gene_type:complete